MAQKFYAAQLYVDRDKFGPRPIAACPVLCQTFVTKWSLTPCPIRSEWSPPVLL